jgi:hypothetical protein
MLLVMGKWGASLIGPFSSPGNADRLNAWSDCYLRFRHAGQFIHDRPYPPALSCFDTDALHARLNLINRCLH